MGDGYPSDWDSRRRRVYRRDNYRCQRCGRSGGPRGNAELHAHHKTPKSRGGSHELHNLTTVCKSCHEDIHGHPIGGRQSGGTGGSSTQDIDPVAFGIALLLVGLAVFGFVTYSAAQQVLPAGQTETKEHVVDYARVVEDPDGYGRDYEYNVGPPLEVAYTLENTVISPGDRTTLRVTVRNPSDRRLSGAVDVTQVTGWTTDSRRVIEQVQFSLAPGETHTEELTVASGDVAAYAAGYPASADYWVEAYVSTDPYAVTDVDSAVYDRGSLTLTVRKPIHKRPGLYWLAFVGAVLAGAAGLAAKRRWERRD